RREPVVVTVFVDLATDAVDPAKAQRLVDRLLPGHAWLAAALSVEADVKLGCRRVVLGQPRPKFRGTRAEDQCWFRRARRKPRPTSSAWCRAGPPRGAPARLRRPGP